MKTSQLALYRQLYLHNPDSIANMPLARLNQEDICFITKGTEHEKNIQTVKPGPKRPVPSWVRRLLSKSTRPHPVGDKHVRYVRYTKVGR